MARWPAGQMSEKQKVETGMWEPRANENGALHLPASPCHMAMCCGNSNPNPKPRFSSLHRKSQTNKKLVGTKVVAAAAEWEKNRKQRWGRKKNFSANVLM